MRLRLLFFILMNWSIPVAGQYRDGMEYFIKDSGMLREYWGKLSLLKDHSALAQAYKRIADYYYSRGVVDSQLFYYKLALHKYELANDSFHISYCYFRIGEELAFHSKRHDESISWHLPAVSYFERSGEYKMAAFSNYAISTLYKSKKDKKLEDYYLKRSVAFNKLARDTLLDIIIVSSKAAELQATNEWDEVYRLANHAVSMSRAITQPVFIKTGLLMMGRASLEKGEITRAIQLLDESRNTVASTNTAHADAIHLLAVAYAQLGNNKAAEDYIRLYKHVSDSISAKKKEENYSELLVQYETERKQAMIAALERENELKLRLAGNQRILIILLAVGLSLVLTTAIIFYRNFKRRQRLEQKINQQQKSFDKQLHVEKEEKMTAEFNRQLAEVQLTALSAQMNPHFIFNCMNSIQKYILKNEKDKALNFLQNFSELMRRVLDNSAQSRITLDDEINMLEKYILLEQQRLDYLFDYKIETAANLQTDFFEIPGMIIQPYVENAIWHGLMNREYLRNSATQKGSLLLLITRENGCIKCVVEDNGVGRRVAAEMEKQKSPERKGYGMIIAQKRLELLQRENAPVPEILVEDLMNGEEPAGTRVTIFINVE